MNNLKDQYGTLSSVSGERKYFDLENKIIIYELQLKQFKYQYETMMRPSFWPVWWFSNYTYSRITKTLVVSLIITSI